MYCSIEEIYNIYNQQRAVCTDTRNVKQGSIFFSLKGNNFNGNEFAENAIKGGAAFAVIDDSNYDKGDKYILVEDSLNALQQLSRFHRERLKIPIIGITGTNGKTTTKELINAILSKRYKTVATSGNLNNHIGVPLTLLSIMDDTEIAIIEMGANHMGEIEELCQLAQPTSGIITNIGIAHTEGFGSYENIIATKKALYDYVKKIEGVLFVNGDDELLMKLSEGTERKFYGKSNRFNCYGEIPDSTPLLNIKLYLKNPDEKTYNELPVQTNLIGKYNIDNILAAVSIGKYFDIQTELIKQALEEYMPGGYRSQYIDTGKNKIIMDAYNANPSSMELAIKNFGELEIENKVAIIGDMFELGKISIEEHQKVVELLKQQKIEKIYLVGAEFLKINEIFKAFENSESALKYFKDNPLKAKTILIKGSRGIKLEKVIEAL